MKKWLVKLILLIGSLTGLASLSHYPLDTQSTGKQISRARTTYRIGTKVEPLALLYGWFDSLPKQGIRRAGLPCHMY